MFETIQRIFYTWHIHTERRSVKKSLKYAGWSPKDGCTLKIVGKFLDDCSTATASNERLKRISKFDLTDAERLWNGDLGAKVYDQHPLPH